MHYRTAGEKPLTRARAVEVKDAAAAAATDEVTKEVGQGISYQKSYPLANLLW